MLLFYVRHGDPIYNPDSLTPLGERQAEAVAHRLSLYGIDRIFVSSSNRAMQTAAPTAQITKKEPVVLDWCNESYAWRDFTVKTETGKDTWCFQHEPTRALFASPEMTRLGDDWPSHPFFAGRAFGEGIRRYREKTDEFLASLGYRHDRASHTYTAVAPNDERVALFAHQGFGLVFLSTVLDIPYPAFCTHFDIAHSSVSVIEFATHSGVCIPQMLSFSNDSHLYRDGLPTCFQNRLYF